MEKKIYNKPMIEVITLDFEISLVLQSTPPLGPSEDISNVQSPFNPNINLA